MKKVKFGVIGLKGIGQTHLNAIVSAGEAELLAVADINEEVGTSVASKYGVEWYKDYEKMLERKDLDVVTICTPHFLHAPMAIEALEYGKHVLVEKPMAVTVSEADGMITKAGRQGLKLGVVFQLRTSPLYREIKRLIETGELGHVYRVCMEACVFRTQTYYDADAWRGKWATEGGGVLINQVIHYLDLLQWLVGQPAELQGRIGTLLHDIEVEDIASATIQFENGAHGVIQVSTVDLPEKVRYEICADKGKIITEDDEAKRAVLDKSIQEYMSQSKPSPRPEIQWNEMKEERKPLGHTVVIKDFTEAILENREPLVTGEDGRTALEIVNAIILSSFEKKNVSFPVDRQAYDRLMGRLAKRN